MTFDCPRCGAEVTEKHYGPCTRCARALNDGADFYKACRGLAALWPHSGRTEPKPSRWEP